MSEQVEITFGRSLQGMVTLAYNIGGTRGVGHAVINTKTGVATIKIYETPEGKSVTESIKKECKELQITSRGNSIIKGKIF